MVFPFLRQVLPAGLVRLLRSTADGKPSSNKEKAIDSSIKKLEQVARENTIKYCEEDSKKDAPDAQIVGLQYNTVCSPTASGKVICTSTLKTYKDIICFPEEEEEVPHS